MNFKFLLKKCFKYRLALFLFLGLLVANQMNAQVGSTITGEVLESEGQTPLPGVNIIEKGTKNGASTDFDGNFSIKLTKPNTILEFSYMGFVTQEVSVSGKSTISVVLQPDMNTLDEVVVIGYGTSKKSDLTGSIVSVSGNELKERPVSNLAEALTGRMAGVQVTSTEGSPDAEFNIRIRGGGSITQDSSPLIIVDGFPVDSMGDVASSDIESISILKDASSTAIYGARGANGVVIITTKSGKDGKTEVSFNSFHGFKSIAETIDVLDPEDFVKWQYEYALLTKDNLDSYEKYFGQWQDYDQYIGMKGNNWQEQIYGKLGEVDSQDLGIRGGGEKLRYNFNFTRFDQKAIMLGSDFVRNNLSLALKSKINEKVDLSFKIRYSNTEVNGGGANEQNEISSADSRLKHSVGYSPIPLPGLTTDNTDEALSSYLVHPLVAVDDNQREKLKKNFNLQGSFSWKIIDNLKFITSFGLDNYNTLDYRFYGSSTYYSKNRPNVENQGAPAIMYTDEKKVRFKNSNTIDYNFEKFVGENHSLKLLLGEEIIITETNKEANEVHGFPSDFDFQTAKSLVTEGVPFSVENNYAPDNKLLSFFGRLNYSFMDRYLFTATYRADGSSKFLGDKQWGYFPSAALAWKIKEEDFLKDVDWINSLKVRLSYGEAGNNNIPNGQQVRYFQPKTTSYINDVSSYWAPSGTMPNPNLIWETTVTQNVGLDFGLFDGRITGSVEAYKNLTQDLLMKYPTSGSGYSYQYRNMGENQNTGIEASLNIVAIEKENYGLNISFNIGVNKNKINSLGIMDDFGQATNWASSQIGNDYLVTVGGSIGDMYGYQSDGRYEVSDFDYDVSSGAYTLKAGVANNSGIVGTPMPGNMKLKDISGPDGVPDGVVDANDNTIIGHALPDHTGGLVLNANAYGFDLSAAFNWSVGNDVYNANKIEFTTSNNNGQYRNLSTIMADGNRWTNLDPASGQLVTDPNQLEALNANTTMWSPYMKNYVFSDWAVEDGSFLRLNTLTLGYTTPEEVASKIGASKLRFFVTANNVFTVTNYSGPDPESSTRRKTPLTPGVDYSAYPRSRQVVLGLNLNF